jgi:hypothetical protein
LEEPTSSILKIEESKAGVWKDQSRENKKISQSEQGIGKRKRYSPVKTDVNGAQERPFSGLIQRKALSSRTVWKPVIMRILCNQGPE